MFSNSRLFLILSLMTTCWSHPGTFAAGTNESWQPLAIQKTRVVKCKGRPFVWIRPQDELWVVSARDAHCSVTGLAPLTCSRFVDGQICPVEIDSLYDSHQSNRSLRTVLFIHGNRTDADWATSRGAQVYQKIFAGNECSTPVRYVIWQWRSEPEINRPVKDYLIKSSRAVNLGPTMARFLRDFGDRELTLIGYSLGSQVLLSAFSHGCMIDFPSERGYQLNLIATAIECEFGKAIGRQACTTELVDQTNIFQNDWDRGVRVSEKVCKKRYGARATTLSSIVQRTLVPLGQITTYNISGEVGKRHSIVRYAGSHTVRKVIANAVEQRQASPMARGNQPDRESIKLTGHLAG